MKFTNSIYNVNIYNNIFYYGLASDGYTLLSYTIPRGNYDIYSLLTVLNSIGDGFVFTYSETTFKITITNTQDFYLYNNTHDILKVLGFSNEDHYSTSNILTSNQFINLVGAQMLYVSIPNISMNSYGIRNSNSSNKSIICSIPVSVLQGDTQIYTSDLRHAVNNDVITHLEIIITDEDDNEVNFNGVDWYLNLYFIFSYKKQYLKPNYLTDVSQESTEQV